MDKQEITKLQAYFRLKFKMPEIRIEARPKKKKDSAEVFIGDEFIGVIYRRMTEDGELSWNFQMAILRWTSTANTTAALFRHTGLQRRFRCAPVLTYLMYAPLRCSKRTPFSPRSGEFANCSANL